MAEIRRGNNFRLEKIIFVIKKVILTSLNPISEGKYRKAMNHSHVKKEIYDFIPSEIEQPISEILGS